MTHHDDAVNNGTLAVQNIMRDKLNTHGTAESADIKYVRCIRIEKTVEMHFAFYNRTRVTAVTVVRFRLSALHVVVFLRDTEDT